MNQPRQFETLQEANKYIREHICVDTLESARQHLRDHWEEGTICDCCKRPVKLYRNKLMHTQAVALINLYRQHRLGQEWVHADRFDYYRKPDGSRPRGHNFAEMRHWGLIEQMPKDPDNKKLRTSGFWKITEEGEKFVKGEISVQERVRLFDSTPYGFEGKQIFIKDALRNKFDYDELMNP